MASHHKRFHRVARWVRNEQVTQMDTEWTGKHEMDTCGQDRTCIVLNNCISFMYFFQLDGKVNENELQVGLLLTAVKESFSTNV